VYLPQVVSGQCYVLFCIWSPRLLLAALRASQPFVAGPVLWDNGRGQHAKRTVRPQRELDGLRR
jgi:hypothetical protein